jgi:hypothetical protein
MARPRASEDVDACGCNTLRLASRSTTIAMTTMELATPISVVNGRGGLLLLNKYKHLPIRVAFVQNA